MLADEHTLCDILFLIGDLGFVESGFVESALYVPCGVLTEKVDSKVMASVLFIDFTVVRQSVTLKTNHFFQ